MGTHKQIKAMHKIQT